MAVGFILGFLFVALCIGGFIFCGYSFYNEYKVRGWIGVATGVVGLLLFVFIPFSFHTVDTGEIAVVKHMGNAKEVRTAGTYYDFWVTEKYEKYDAKVQNIDITSMAYSKDAQTMDVAMTVQFQIDTSKAIDIAKHYGTMTTLASRIQSITIEKTKSVLTR